MEAAIGGRHTVTEVTTTPTRRHTVARITATVIITARLITITTPEPMDGMGVLMARTDLRIGAQAIILIQARTPEAVLSRLLMEPEAQHKRIIHTPAPTRRRDKVQARTLNGAVAGAETSQGGKAAASSTKWGNSAAGKTASGNMYAAHDGNVYKNTGNGWQKYDNGSWNSVNKPQPNWQGAENNQQRTGSESYQQRSSSGTSSANRSAEGSSERSSGGYNRSSGE